MRYAFALHILRCWYTNVTKLRIFITILGCLIGCTPVYANEQDAAAKEPLPQSSQVARKELQKLLDEGLQLLAQELVEKGTFYPFMVMLGHDGEMRLIGTPISLRNDNPEKAVDALVQKAKGLAHDKRIRAAAFFMDYVATRNDTGFSQAGIRVELDHQHPDALSVFVPYSITEDKKLRLMTPQYKSGKNVVFLAAP